MSKPYTKLEDKIKIGIADYLNYKYPHVPFNMSWDHVRLPIGTAKKLKRMRWANPDFVWPDLFIAWPNRCFNGLWGEIKKDKSEIFLKSGELSQSKQIQRELKSLQLLHRLEFQTFWMYSVDQAIRIIDEYINYDKKTKRSLL